jgi:hypothetical protein
MLKGRKSVQYQKDYEDFHAAQHYKYTTHILVTTSHISIFMIFI